MQTEWKEVTAANTIDIKKLDRPFVGLYTGKDEGVGENNSTVHHFEVEKEDFGVWGSAVIDSKLSRIPFGKEVMIEYLGKKKSEKGGREYHDFRVAWRDVPFTPLED